ncbi:hypothetical protein AAC387_Pa08g2026 [Persea americana]
MRAAVKLQLPVFLLSERRKAGKSTFPPMRPAVKLQLPVFLLSERRKTGKSSLPPMRAAVKLQFGSCFLSEWRKSSKCEFTAHASSGLELSGPNQQAAGQMELAKQNSKTTQDRIKTPHSCSHAQKSSDVSITRACFRV